MLGDGRVSILSPQDIVIYNASTLSLHGNQHQLANVTTYTTVTLGVLYVLGALTIRTNSTVSILASVVDATYHVSVQRVLQISILTVLLTSYIGDGSDLHVGSTEGHYDSATNTISDCSVNIFFCSGNLNLTTDSSLRIIGNNVTGRISVPGTSVYFCYLMSGSIVFMDQPGAYGTLGRPRFTLIDNIIDVFDHFYDVYLRQQQVKEYALVYMCRNDINGMICSTGAGYGSTCQPTGSLQFVIFKSCIHTATKTISQSLSQAPTNTRVETQSMDNFTSTHPWGSQSLSTTETYNMSCTFSCVNVQTTIIPGAAPTGGCLTLLVPFEATSYGKSVTVTIQLDNTSTRFVNSSIIVENAQMTQTPLSAVLYRPQRLVFSRLRCEGPIRDP